MAAMSDGIAVASACGGCAPLIGDPAEFAPGRHMAIIDGRHIPGLIAAGWVLTSYPHDPPDVVCSHYHAAHWHDGQ